MDNFIILFVIITIINLFLFKQNQFLSKKIKLIDYPDNLRKIHKKEIAITGGLFIFINLILLLLILKLNIFQSIEFFLEYKRQAVSFILLMFSLFIIGLYDDKYDLNPFKKLFLSAFVILICLLIDESLIINELRFLSIDYSIQLLNLSIPFTLLSILLFLNALNMFDGIDLQVSIYVFLLFIYFIFKFNIDFLIFLLPVMIFIIYFNFKKKLFLGDSGTNILAGLVSYIIIKEYNNDYLKISCEEIFLLMMLPGIDMLRLFLNRIIKGKNPFSSDNQHIHHLYLNIFQQNLTILIIQLHIFLPILIFIFYNKAILYLLILSIMLYLFNMIYLKLKIKH